MKKYSQLICSILTLPFCASAFAMDSTELLPASINSPAFKYGMISGVDSKYGADGSIKTLNDINTVHFNGEQLSKIDTGVAQFVSILNNFSKDAHLGTQLDLGSMRIESEPNIRYMVPIYARGITDNFSVAAAVPILRYQNKLSIVQSSSNVSSICAQVTNGVAGEASIRDACAQLGVGVGARTAQKLAELGYKPIQDRDESIMGDAQVIGLWKFFEQDNRSAMLKGTLGLPTGHKDDPNDLADIGGLGLTSFEPMFVFNFLPLSKLRLSAKGGYKMVFADSAEMRVPSSPDDVLPTPQSREKVKRNVGDTVTLGTAATYDLFSSLSIAGGYEYARKSADAYRGSRGQRYDLLSKDTNASAHRLRGGISYDTIGLYKRTKSFPPLKLDFEVTNTIAGVNVERQLVNEFTLTMFF